MVKYMLWPSGRDWESSSTFQEDDFCCLRADFTDW
jgi:hypothetical protein